MSSFISSQSTTSYSHTNTPSSNSDDDPDLFLIRQYFSQPEPYLSTYGEDLGYDPAASKLYNDRLAFIAAILSKAALKRLKQFQETRKRPALPQTFTRMTRLPEISDSNEDITAEEHDLYDTFEACFPPDERDDLFMLMEWLRWDPEIEFHPEVSNPHVYISEDAIKRSMFGYSAKDDSILERCQPFMQDQLIPMDGIDLSMGKREIPSIFDRALDMEFRTEEERRRAYNHELLKNHVPI